MSSLGPITGTTDTCQDVTSRSLSRSSEDLSLSDEPPPLPTSPIPTEPLISCSTDLSDVQVSDLSMYRCLYSMLAGFLLMFWQCCCLWL